MDMVTGAQVAVAPAVPIPRERARDLVTAVGRIGEWRPERYSSGRESTVNCVVTEAVRPRVFAWTVLDDAGLVGSFTHRPGASGAREGAEADPRALDSRLVTQCQNMATTIVAMANADSAIGAAR